jgi:tRNA (guanine37-N1)-methyltransferase
VELGYDYWSACELCFCNSDKGTRANPQAEVLNAILPDVATEDAPSSFTQTGHIGELTFTLLSLAFEPNVG